VTQPKQQKRTYKCNGVDHMLWSRTRRMWLHCLKDECLDCGTGREW
jgi:hypothetical protein